MDSCWQEASRLLLVIYTGTISMVQAFVVIMLKIKTKLGSFRFALLRSADFCSTVRKTLSASF